jgi:hypothetical protein
MRNENGRHNAQPVSRGTADTADSSQYIDRKMQITSAISGYLHCMPDAQCARGISGPLYKNPQFGVWSKLAFFSRPLYIRHEPGA